MQNPCQIDSSGYNRWLGIVGAFLPLSNASDALPSYTEHLLEAHLDPLHSSEAVILSAAQT